MENDQITAQDLVLVEVQDEPDLSFTFNIPANAVMTKSDIQPDCTIKITRYAFDQLIAGNTTFEKLVHQNQLKISGRHLKLREFGGEVRSKKQDSLSNPAE